MKTHCQQVSSFSPVIILKLRRRFMVFSAVHNSRFPLQVDSCLISFCRNSLLWLSLDAKKCNEFKCPSNIIKTRFDTSFLFAYCSKHVLVFDNDNLIATVHKSYDRVVLYHDVLYCIDEVLKIINYKFVDDKKMKTIAFQKYSMSEKYLCVLEKGQITWFSICQLKMLAIANTQDTLPHRLPSFVLNMHLFHPSYPLLLLYTYDSFYIVDMMNTVQFGAEIECPVQHHFCIQNYLLFIYTNKYICLNVLTMELVSLPFDVIKPESCKSYKSDLFIACVFSNNILVYDLQLFTITQFELTGAINDLCIFNSQIFYVNGDDKVYHIYKVDGQWGQDYIKVQDWVLTRLKVIEDKMYLGSTSEWFIYES
eukprot:NODE_675_length_5306_cov_0.405224.p2 type:complete len:366 gc:universal NODE_675_length_5306_cov_0.405224:2168-3265(+)